MLVAVMAATTPRLPVLAAWFKLLVANMVPVDTLVTVEKTRDRRKPSTQTYVSTPLQSIKYIVDITTDQS